LPLYRVFLGREEHWFLKKEDVEHFVAEESKKRGHELRVADEPHTLDSKANAGTTASNGIAEGETSNGDAAAETNKEPLLQVVELHEVRSLNDGLRDLRDGMENPRLREILTSVVEDMEGGRMLSQCLGQHPAIFNNVFVSLVRAGEQSGQMT
jgi:hypothetical protein